MIEVEPNGARTYKYNLLIYSPMLYHFVLFLMYILVQSFWNFIGIDLELLSASSSDQNQV
jgi:hypothetical protein